MGVRPRQNSCRPNRTKNLGAAIKVRNGTLRTGLDPGSICASVNDCESVKCDLFLSSVMALWIADQVRNDREKMKSFQGVE